MKISKTAMLAFDNFDLEAAHFAEQIRHWLHHEKMVESQKGKDIPPIERYTPYARPRAHPLLEAAVDDAGNVSYEVDDDTLETRKNELTERLLQAEHAAIAAVVPARSVRHFAQLENDIRQKDAELRQMMMERKAKPGILKRIFKSDALDVQELESAVAEQRTEKNTEHLKAQLMRCDRVAAIQKIAAAALHEIEGLTLDNIEQWKLPDFTGV